MGLKILLSEERSKPHRCGNKGDEEVVGDGSATIPLFMLIDPDQVALTDLNEDTRMIAEVIGKEMTLKLVEVLGGTRLHIQSPRPLLQRQVREQALKLYDGTNAVAVCQATGLNARQLRRIVRDAAR